MIGAPKPKLIESKGVRNLQVKRSRQLKFVLYRKTFLKLQKSFLACSKGPLEKGSKSN